MIFANDNPGKNCVFNGSQILISNILIAGVIGLLYELLYSLQVLNFDKKDRLTFHSKAVKNGIRFRIRAGIASRGSRKDEIFVGRGGVRTLSGLCDNEAQGKEYSASESNCEAKLDT